MAGKPLENIIKSIPRPVLIILLSAFIFTSAWYSLKFNKSNPFQIEVPANRFPLGTVSFIKENSIKGNMLVFFDWAEYCIWKLYPDCRVFLDGRFTDAYSHETVTDYLSFIYFENNWANIIRKYPVDMLLLHKGNDAYSAMPCLDNWKLVCEDEISGLFLNANIHSNSIATLRRQQPTRIKNNSTVFFP